MRPSIPRSPTCALFGIPPSATTAQFSNSNAGYLRSSASVFGRSRTMNPRPIAQSFSSSFNPQSFSIATVERIDVIPDRTELNSFAFVQVTFVLRDGSGLRLNDAPFTVKFLHVVFAVTPVTLHT